MAKKEPKLWGEIPPPKVEWEKVVPKDLGELVILSAIKPELPKVHQPPPDEDANTLVTLPPECSKMEETVVETINLIQYSRKIQKLINIASSSQQKNMSEKLEPCPPFPELSEKKKPRVFFSVPKGPSTSCKKEESLLGASKGVVKQPRLSSENTRQILEKTVCTLIAHAGFDTSMKSALRVLTDVADNYMRNMTIRLRIAVDQQILRRQNVFPDAIERVFLETGLGSMRTLQGFYKSSVLDYREKVLNECTRLVEEYQVHCALLQVKDSSYIRFKKEDVDDADIPEIHFPAVGEGVDIDELQPSLKPGFPMLDSLEQEIANSDN